MSRSIYRIGRRFHPVSQVLQEFPQMDELRARMENLTGTVAPAKVQMLVRVGHTTQPGLSPRRDLNAIVETGTIVGAHGTRAKKEEAPGVRGEKA
jgi:hypothetical protein